MANKAARVIVPFVLGVWLLASVVFRASVPAEVRLAFVLLFAATVPVLVFYLMADMGWRVLARSHRTTVPFDGRWQACPTAQMSMLSVSHQDYEQTRLRLVGTLHVGITAHALYLSMLFSKVPLLGRFFPDVQIDWPSIRQLIHTRRPAGTDSGSRDRCCKSTTTRTTHGPVRGTRGR